MKIWVVKAIIQKAISFLPYSNNINYLFQKYVTKGVNLTDDYFIDKLTHSRNHFYFFQKYKQKINNFKALEIGTGWYPIVPICLFLLGSNDINSIDINKLTSRKKLYNTIQKFIKFNNNGDLTKYIKVCLPERIRYLENIYKKFNNYSYSEILQKLKINLIVGDSKKLPFNDNYFDLAVSNNVFEHIIESDLKQILIEQKRVIKDKGIMSHFIDMTDHFSHMDANINEINFLKFSDKKWRIINNSVQPVNRYRINHFRKIYNEIGINIDEEFNKKIETKKLEETKLYKKFADIDKKDLLISHSLIISKIIKATKINSE